LNRTKRKALQLKVDTLPEDVRKRIVPVGGDMRVSSVKRRNLEFRECVSQPKAHDATTRTTTTESFRQRAKPGRLEA
jgi:hypothetical protein